VDNFDPNEPGLPAVAPPPAAPPVAAPSPLQDPRFAAFLAKQAQDRAELAAAQGRGEEARKWADVGNSFRRAQDIFLGRPTESAAAEQARLTAASDRPVQQLLQRQATERQGTKDFAEQEDVRQKLLMQEQSQKELAQLNDPNSAETAVRRALTLKYVPGIPPELVQRSTGAQLQRSFPILEQLAKPAEQLATAGKTTAETGKITEETKQVAPNAELGRRKTTAEIVKAYADAEKARADAENLLGGKPIPEPVAQKLVNQAEALKALDELERLHRNIHGLKDKAGAAVSAASGGLINVNGAQGTYNDALKQLAPAIAAGALPLGRETPGAVEEFKKSMPLGITDHDRAKAAFAQLRKSIRENAKGQVDVLRQGRYSTSQIGELDKRLQEDAAATSGGQSAPTAQLAKFKQSLQPGEQMAVGPDGIVRAFGPHEQIPPDHQVVQ